MISLRKLDMGVGEMTTQWLKALAVLTENQCSIPRTHVTAHNIPFQGIRYPLLSSMDTHVHAGKHTHKIKNIVLKNRNV